MKIEFTYSRFDQSGSVKLNGRQAGEYSCFTRCFGQPFFSWFEHLPQYCRQEANEPYTFTYNGSALEAMILKKLFQEDSQCTAYSANEELIGIDSRMKWVRDLKPHLKNPVKRRVKITSAHAEKDAAAINAFLVPYTSATLEAVSDSRDPQIVFTKDTNLSGRYTSSSHPVCMLTNSSDTGYVFTEGSCHVFKADFSRMEEFLNLWLDETVYPDLFCRIQSSSLDSSDSLLARKKDMLSADMPYLALQVSSAKIELSQTPAWSVIRLPENHPCTLKTDNEQVIRIGASSLIPVQEGTAHLSVSSLLIPSLKDTRKIEVYRYYAITDLTLFMQGSSVIKGQQFQVNLAYAPSNAMNTSAIRWQVSDPKAIRIVSASKNQGVFLADAPGTYSIYAQADNVRKSITVTVLPAAEKVKLSTNDLKLKQKEKNVFVKYSILPLNAAKAKVCFDVSDPSVISVDAQSGEVTAHREGMCVLSAVLFDHHGNAVHEDRCTVTVLPPKDVYSPSLSDVTALIAMMCMLVSANPEVMFPAALICISASVYACFKTSYRWQYWLYGSFIALSILIPFLKIYAR